MEEEREPEAKRLKEGGVITTEGAGGDDNDDDVWSKMKTVHDKSSSKRKLCAGLYLKLFTVDTPSIALRNEICPYRGVALS